jgi:hypothetical protein
MLTLPLSLVEITAIAAFIFVHDAPSGFQYPLDCCGGHDCRPIACSTASFNPNDGSVMWTGLHFQREQVKISRDSGCHVCVGYGLNTRFRYPHCIFLAPVM